MAGDSYGAAVFWGEYILLIQCRNGMWSFPKGHTENGETHVISAKREVWEETGIHASIDESCACKVPSLRGGANVTFYYGEYLSGDVQPQESEVLDAGWYKHFTARELMSSSPDAKVLETMLEYYQKSILSDRNHYNMNMAKTAR